MRRRPSRSTLLHYTTLFRSQGPRTGRCPRVLVGALGGGRLLGTAFEADRDVDRKSTRLNSSHLGISYAVFCLKKKSPPEGTRDVANEEPEKLNRRQKQNATK